MSVAEGESTALSSSGGEPGYTEPPLVLVVGRSRINSIVVSRIAERSGLRSMSQQPEHAVEAISVFGPAAVILDGGTDNRDCDDVLVTLKTARNTSGLKSPIVILLSTRNVAYVATEASDVIDAVVAKPILPELLQPVLDRLLGRTAG